MSAMRAFELDPNDDLILIVDDEPAVLRSTARALERGGYRCLTAESADAARQILEREQVSLIISDVNMPGSSGIDLLASLADRQPDTAMIMLTGSDDADLASQAVRLGAYGYVIKPLSPSAIVITVMNALARRELALENRAHRERLELAVKHRETDLWTALLDLERSQASVQAREEETIQVLATAAEFRDDATGAHVRRMALYCELLGRELGMNENDLKLLRLAAPMHDVGKIGVSDRILLKPGPLSLEERVAMQRHPEIGHAILIDSESELLHRAAEISLTHHERFDGEGYPHGLEREEIPINGRIAAVADVFDALTTDRVYRKAFPLVRALDMMREERSHQFDPDVLHAFENVIEDAVSIHVRYKDA